MLFEPSGVAPGTFTYDVAADGRFVMLQSTGWKQKPTEITLVQNWFEELKARVAARP